MSRRGSSASHGSRPEADHPYLQPAAVRGVFPRGGLHSGRRAVVGVLGAQPLRRDSAGARGVRGESLRPRRRDRRRRDNRDGRTRRARVAHHVEGAAPRRRSRPAFARGPIMRASEDRSAISSPIAGVSACSVERPGRRAPRAPCARAWTSSRSASAIFPTGELIALVRQIVGRGRRDEDAGPRQRSRRHRDRGRRRRRAPARRLGARRRACACVAPEGSSIGRSVHSLAEVDAAVAGGGCDYLLFGTVFPSEGKPDGHPVAGLDGAARGVRAFAAAGDRDRRHDEATRRTPCGRPAPRVLRRSACSCV